MSEEISHKALELSEDLDFIQWVRSGFRHNASHWNTLKLEADSSADIEQAIELVESIQFKQIEIDATRQNQIFDNILEGIDEKPVVSMGERKKTFRLWPLVAAASVALMLYFFWPAGEIMNYETDLAQNLELTLPDKSVAYLNADSELSYSGARFEQRRALKLNGEAFFEVEKGSTFSVLTPNGKVEVLGTSFNVFARDNRLEVSCITGKVRVSNYSGDSEKLLEAGESCVFVGGKLQEDSSQQDGSWKKGMFYYNGDKLSDVFEEIKRQFDVDVKADEDIKSMLYTGFFESGELSKALESILWPMGLSYSMDSDKTVVVTKEQSGTNEN